MGKVILGMLMSLDGYVNDREGSVSRLYTDMDAMRNSELLQESMRMTGAVVMGRHSYDMAQGDFTGYEFQVPLFIITHHPPEQVAKGANDKLSFHFVTDGLESAFRQAQTAAGERVVTVIGGAQIIRDCLKAGIGDELHIDIAPILLGGGLRLFDQLDQPIELEVIKIEQTPIYTHLRYRIVR